MSIGKGFKFRLNDEDMPAKRSRITLDALTRKAGVMRDKRDRKPLEAKQAWKKDIDEES